jgi:pseudouridine-5'-phosphate glycosidase
VLETLGVPVVVLGAREFPAFYSRDSGFPAPLTLDAPADVARLLRAKRALGIGCGVLVANPIPADAALDPRRIEAAIHAALAEAEATGIHGKRITPYLLSRLAEVTGGASIRANRALALHNAEVGAALAVALAT